MFQVRESNNILIVQTAFLGDVVLTLPLAQVLKRRFPSSSIDVLVIPRSKELLEYHPAIHNVILYDKRGKDAGVKGLMKIVSELRDKHYDVAIVPHRSLRSALVVSLARIPLRIGFHTSAGRFFFNQIVRYEPAIHEIDRNLHLLSPLGITAYEKEYPSLYPSEDDILTIDRFLSSKNVIDKHPFVGIAPGTVWNTKRWLKERFVALTERLSSSGYNIVLIGGSEDVDLCRSIASSAAKKNLMIAAGELTLLQSAELIRRCGVLVANDSAPVHLAVAMRTPVLAIFGATVPEFGFAPYGKHDVVVETKGLSCRPCSIHGGDECPITTFDCMVNISAEIVYDNVKRILGSGA